MSEKYAAHEAREAVAKERDALQAEVEQQRQVINLLAARLAEIDNSGTWTRQKVIDWATRTQAKGDQANG